MILQKYKLELILSAVIVCAGVLFDVGVRLSGNNSHTSRDWSYEQPDAFDVKRLSQEKRAELEQFLAQYKPQQPVQVEKPKPKPKPKKTTPKVHIPSEQEQAKQDGILDKLYDGKMLYRLVATFEGEQSFAVLQKRQLDSEERENIRVSNNQKLGSYQVAAIRPGEVELTRNGKRVKLQLFQLAQANKGKPSGQ